MRNASVNWPAKPSSREWAVALLLGPLAVACSGDREQVLGGDPCTAGGKALELIDDMERNEKQWSIPPVSGRVGRWFAYNDKAVTRGAEGAQFPDPDQFEMTDLDRDEQRLDPFTRTTSTKAAGTKGGSGYTRWGAGIAVELNEGAPYDASRFKGFRFWIRSRIDESYTLRVSVDDPAYERQVDQNPSGELEDPTRCKICDSMGIDVPMVGVRWRSKVVLWDELEQRGWALKRSEPIATDKLIYVKFQVPERTSFDFVVDDLAFVCDPNYRE